MARTLVAITGASSGIGEAFARRLAPEHDLLLVARRRDRLEKLASELSAQYPTRVEIMPADLTNDADVDQLAQQLATDPNLVLLVNNAGFGTRGLFWRAPLNPQEDMHKVHVMAPLRLTHAALSNMVPRDVGAVINVASIASFVRTPGNVSYSATKAWLSTFTEGLYTELKSTRSQVVVQALCPGYTYSEFHEVLGVDRDKLSSPAMWLTAEFVVNESLKGLRRRKLYVIPGWRYRLLVGFLNALPSGMRLLLESSLKRTLPENLPEATRKPEIGSR